MSRYRVIENRYVNDVEWYLQFCTDHVDAQELINAKFSLLSPFSSLRLDQFPCLLELFMDSFVEYVRNSVSRAQVGPWGTAFARILKLLKYRKDNHLKQPFQFDAT